MWVTIRISRLAALEFRVMTPRSRGGGISDQDPTTSACGRRLWEEDSGGAQPGDPGAAGTGGRPGQLGRPQREQPDRVGGAYEWVRHHASVVQRHRRDRLPVDEREQYLAVERP